MTPVLALALTTVPDVAGIRTLYGFADTIADSDVAEFALQRQRARSGDSTMPHHLQRIIALSWVLQRDDEISGYSAGDADTDEASLLQALADIVAQQAPLITTWNSNTFDLLRYRALIAGVALPLPRANARDTGQGTLEALPYAAAPLEDMAKLCGYPALPALTSDSAWETYRAGRFAEIHQRTDLGAVTTYLMYLRNCLVSGGLSTADYQHAQAAVRDWVSRQGATHWQDLLAGWPVVPS